MAEANEHELTPEQKAQEEEFARLGLKDEVLSFSDSALMGEEAEPQKEAPKTEPKTEETPPKETPPAPTPKTVTITEEELKAIKDRAAWAEREKERADKERERAERVEAENTRLRSTPAAPPQPVIVQAPQPKPEKKQRTEEELKALNWLKENMAEVLPEVFAALPAEVLEKHPVIQARDRLTVQTREEVEAQSFLLQFEPKQRQAVQTHLLPVLKAQRVASGFRKGFNELFDERRQAAQATMEVFGFKAESIDKTPDPTPPPVVTPPAPVQPPVVASAPKVQVPPTLTNVHGGNQGAQKAPQPFTKEELKLWGFS